MTGKRKTRAKPETLTRLAIKVEGYDAWSEAGISLQVFVPGGTGQAGSLMLAADFMVGKEMAPHSLHSLAEILRMDVKFYSTVLVI